MKVVCQIFLDLLHILKFLILCDFFFQFKKRQFRHRNVIALGVIVVSSLLVSLYTKTEFVAFLVCLSVEIVLFVLYHEKVWTLLIVGMWSVFIVTFLDMMSAVLLGTIFKMTTVLEGDKWAVLFGSLITVWFLFLTGRFIKRKSTHGLRNIGIPYMMLFALLTLADARVLRLFGEITLRRLEKRADSIIGYVFIVVTLGLFLQLLLVLLLIVSRDAYREKEVVTQKYLDEQIKYYEYLELREHETKKFRHDLRNHVYILTMLCRNKEYERMNEYLEEMNGKIDVFSNTLSVNHGIVDAVLNQYQVEAKKRKQELCVKGHFPLVCHIGAYDLCTIFSNLLSNACEAAPENSVINVMVRYNEQEIIFVVENEYIGEILVKDREIQTKKKDWAWHGLGMENVKECVRKNGGHMNISTESQKFVVMVLLKNEGEKNEAGNRG